jgi:hypothetical protein
MVRPKEINHNVEGGLVAQKNGSSSNGHSGSRVLNSAPVIELHTRGGALTLTSTALRHGKKSKKIPRAERKVFYPSFYSFYSVA